MKRRMPTKRTVIIAVIAVLIVIGGGVYTWQSLAAWKGYETRLTAEQAEYTTLKDTVLKGKNADERLQALRKLDDKLDDRAKLCDMHGLYAWQASVVPQLKDGVATCKAALQRLNVLAKPLSELREYLDVADKIADTVGTLAPQEVFTEKNWTQIGLERSRTVQQDLSKLPVSGDAAALKSQATVLSGNLTKAWEALVVAHNAKDKTSYLSSSAAVLKAYADFAGLADNIDDVIKTKVNALTTATRA